MYTQHFNNNDELLSEKTHNESNHDFNLGGNIVALADTGYLYINTYYNINNRSETLWGRRDAQGEIIWEHQNLPLYYFASDDRISRIILTADHKVVVSEFVDERNFVEDPRTDMGGDYIIHSFTLDGEQEWEQVLTYPALQNINQIYPAANGDIIGVGQKVVTEFEGVGDIGYFTAWLFRMNPEGEMLWERYFLSPHFPDMEHWFEDVVELDDGRIAATGLYWAITEEGQLNADAWLLVTDADGCLEPGCGEQILVDTETSPPAPTLELEVSPNPARDQIHIRLPGLREEAVLEILDLQGRRLYRSPFAGELRVDVRELPRSLVLVYIYGPDAVISKKVVLE